MTEHYGKDSGRSDIKLSLELTWIMFSQIMITANSYFKMLFYKKLRETNITSKQFVKKYIPVMPNKLALVNFETGL